MRRIGGDHDFADRAHPWPLEAAWVGSSGYEPPALTPWAAGRKLIAIKISTTMGRECVPEDGGQVMPTDSKPMAGPDIRAIHPWTPGNAERPLRHQLLSDNERARLAKVAQIVRFKKGEHIYERGDVSDAAFNVMSGVVVAYRALGKDDHVTAFLHPGDLFGLSEMGRYTNATRAATPVVAYKIPLPAVRRILDNDADFDVNVIVKLCEEMREAQRHAFLLAHKRATTRLAMFLDLQEQLQGLSDQTASEIFLPMDRSSIAAYLGLTLSALSRAFRSLISTNIIRLRDRHHVKIVDRDAFNQMADTYPVAPSVN